MAQTAFVSAFPGTPISSPRSSFPSHPSISRPSPARRTQRPSPPISATLPSTSSRPTPKSIAIISKSPSVAQEKLSNTIDESPSKGGLFGMKAAAYWESIGAVPLTFAGIGVLALAIKMFKVKSGEMRGTPPSLNRVTLHKTVITSEEEEAELHVFKCGGCGYEIYPARGREFKFFPDSFKCPLCGTPKSEFWDLNDPNDPRNQESEEDDDGEGEGDGGGGVLGEERVISDDSRDAGGNDGAESPAKDRAGRDTSM